MKRDWEAQFRQWAKPPSQTEQDRCDNAESAIHNAIEASEKLQAHNVSVFTQGSYKNNTNVRRDSDVDIGIRCGSTFLNDYPEGTTSETFDFFSSDYQYEQFKNEVEEALVIYFGRAAVKRGNKAFDIHETSYHVEADVAAFFTHRRFSKNSSYHEGVALFTDNENRRIINWPEQHYDNGVDKNKKTGKRFKSIVRILKALSNEMAEAGISAGDVPGFLIECLVWNVENDHFQHLTFHADVRAALAFLFNNTRSHEQCKEWGEVSELIYLFHSQQKWTWQKAHAFIAAAWDYIGFED